MSEAPKAASMEQWPYDPHATPKCTDAFYRFIVEYDNILGLFFFITTTAARMDEMQARAAHALADEEERKKPLETFNKEAAFRRVRKYSRLLARNLLVSMIDNFHCYLSEILQDVMTKRHEVLRSSERITTEDVLQFERIQDLRAFIADKKINELSYGGLKQIHDFIFERLGIEMFVTDEERALLTILVELRNVHTHNRGIVNQLFLNRIGNGHANFSFTLGKAYNINFDEFIVLSRTAINIAQRLDEKIAVKFKLKRAKYKNRLAKERAKVRVDNTLI